MSFIIYFAGLVIGVAAFIYLYTLAASGKEKIVSIKNPKQQPVQKLEDGNIAFRNRPALPPGTRVCPLCGSALTKFEGLYASKVLDKNSAKIMIMGCRYCFKEDEDPERPKKNMV